MRGFPMGFLAGFLSTQNVSYFMGAKSHTEIRKHSLKSRVNIGGKMFPTLYTVSTRGNILFPLSFLEGFLRWGREQAEEMLPNRIGHAPAEVQRGVSGDDPRRSALHACEHGAHGFYRTAILQGERDHTRQAIIERHGFVATILPAHSHKQFQRLVGVLRAEIYRPPPAHHDLLRDGPTATGQGLARGHARLR